MTITKLKALLVLLVSSLALTGISFIDGKVWDIVFLILGLIAYAVVGVLFSIGFLRGSEQGKEAYAFVFVLLILGGFAIYKGLESFKVWVLNWPLIAKILVPTAIGLLAIGVFVIIIVLSMKGRKNSSKE